MNKNQLTKIYLETNNVCNLSCSFCHGTSREKRFMTYAEFLTILGKIKGKAKYLYLHLMGEPLLNEALPEMAHAARLCGFEVMLTTNGTLLQEKGDFIYKTGDIKKVSISLQAADIIESAPSQITGEKFEKYIKNAADFAKKCSDTNVICVLRLWNIEEDKDKKNDIFLEKLHMLFPDVWIKNRSGFKLFNAPLGEKEVYLEFGKKFKWPNQKNTGKFNAGPTFCYAIRDQIGILCDGTVVPCCLDADGVMSLGNIFENDLEKILSSKRALDIISSFQGKKECEALCRSCGYASQQFKYK